MSEDTVKLNETINQLAVQIMLIEPDDLMTLGSILERIENIEKMDLRSLPKSMGAFTGAIREVVEKIILNEIEDPTKGVDLLGKGIKIIQKKVLSPDEFQHLPEEEVFWGEMKSLIGQDRSDFLKEDKKALEGDLSSKGSLDFSQDTGLIKDFIIEAMEHLESIELNIINLEQSPEDKEYMNAIFRPFHTIKGVSGFLNLKEIHQFSHAVESLLDHARNNRLRIHQGIIDFILEAVDLLKNMILGLKAHVDSGQTGLSPISIEPYLEKIAILEKGGISDLALRKTKSDPLDEFEMKTPPLGKILSSKGIISEEAISEALKEQMEEKADLKLGEILIMENKAKPKQVVEALREQKQISVQLAEATIKVETKKLDNLIDMVGELVIAQSLIQQDSVFASVSNQKLCQNFAQLKRITTDLQKISMSLRMVPIRHTFQKMIRLVRDLAKKSGKKVDLVMSGEETEIDRNMVDTLYEPLVHMIRNAIDHGIEAPPKRRETGKAEIGQVFLRAYQKGGNVVIEIEDDGQGLNRAKIKQKAKERHLITEDMSLTEYQIDNLIFEPGFSTADQVTDVSGRGVGMDVVKKTIEKLKGKVEIFSFEGKGCRFVMHVPLTLAIMDGIIVQIGEERYIIPTVFIKETLRPQYTHISTVQKKGDLINVRDTLLPLVKLYDLLGVTPQKRDPWDSLVVVVENEGSQKGLMVDDLIGKQEVVIKNLGEQLKTVKGLAGATIMGDGRVGLILDIHGIFNIIQNDMV